jgi:hypothetical protein
LKNTTSGEAARQSSGARERPSLADLDCPAGPSLAHAGRSTVPRAGSGVEPPRRPPGGPGVVRTAGGFRDDDGGRDDDPLARLVVAFEALIRSHADGDYADATRAQRYLRGEGISIILTDAYRGGRDHR